VLNTSIVLGTVFVGILFFKEKLTKIQWGGIICGVLAVLLVALS
jgi:drug/metabolite transporter (DMT)-like permease